MSSSEGKDCGSGSHFEYMYSRTKEKVVAQLRCATPRSVRTVTVTQRQPTPQKGAVSAVPELPAVAKTIEMETRAAANSLFFNRYSP